MGKFRKKPVIIEAVRWTGSEVEGGAPPWLVEALGKNPDDVGSVIRVIDKVRIKTLEGAVMAAPGDWILKGVEGELYPCRSDIFEKTYQEVIDVVPQSTAS